MATERSEKAVKGYTLVRVMVNYVMGILYVAVGLFLLFPETLGFEMAGFDKVFRYIFGGICIAYGAFRIYRGIRKEY